MKYTFLWGFFLLFPSLAFALSPLVPLSELDSMITSAAKILRFALITGISILLLQTLCYITFIIKKAPEKAMLHLKSITPSWIFILALVLIIMMEARTTYFVYSNLYVYLAALVACVFLVIPILKWKVKTNTGNAYQKIFYWQLFYIITIVVPITFAFALSFSTEGSIFWVSA